jgi:hypothetical protein
VCGGGDVHVHSESDAFLLSCELHLEESIDARNRMGHPGIVN